MTRRVERRAFLAMVGGAAVALTAGCADSAAGDLSGVELNVGDQASRLRALFDASGALEGAPYEVRWQRYSADASVFDGLTAGAADIGLSAAAPAMDAISADAEVKIVSASRSPADGGLVLLVDEDSSISSVTALRDRAVSVTTFGGSAHYWLLRALDEAGMSKDDVKFNFRWPTLAERAFRVGDVDAWVTWDPFAATAQVDRKARVLRAGGDLDQGLSLLCATTDALEDAGKRAAIDDFRGRYARAQRWVLDNPDRYSRSCAELMEIPLRAARIVARRARWVEEPLDDRVARQLQQVADRFEGYGVLRHKITVADHVRRRL